MKNMSLFRFSFLLAFLPVFTCSYVQAQLTTFEDHAGAFDLEGWHGNAHYALVEGYRELTVSMNKQPWEAFTLDLRQTEALAAPYLRFKVKASDNVRLRIDFHDANFANLEDASQLYMIPAGNGYTEVTYEFPQTYKAVDPGSNEPQNASEALSHVLFYVNPGERFAGDLSIKDLHIGSMEQASAPALQPELVVFPNPTHTRVNVDLPQGKAFSLMELYDMAGRRVMHKSLQLDQLDQPAFLDVRSLDKGIYLLTVAGPHEVRSTRVVVQ